MDEVNKSWIQQEAVGQDLGLTFTHWREICEIKV